MKKIEEQLYTIVFGQLNLGEQLPSEESVRLIVNAQIKIQEQMANATRSPFPLSEINAEKIVRKIVDNLSTNTGTHSLVEIADNNHVEWLDRRLLDIQQGLHWATYREYLSVKLSKPIIQELDKSTNKILGRIEDPYREGKWSSRGLVIGDVQSGKTTNFIGLINKGLDAGYKVVIVLSGLHNNLRTQTQERFEEGVTGSNTKDGVTTKICGVAKYIDDPVKLRIEGLTSRSQDLTKIRNPNSTFTLIYSVNKKNVNTLTHLIDYIKSFIPEGQNTHKDLPLLLIDDEADNASINTKKPNFDPSTINRLVKELLSLFDKNAYIGYTATPFANVLIDVENTEDLFPRNFIMCLGRAENYIGPSNVFGEIEDEDITDNPIVEAAVRKTEVDWFRNLDSPSTYRSDWQDFLPNKHDKYYRLKEMPKSLKYAIYSFIIGVTIRNLRHDKNEHKTMLIHVTRFTDVQKQIVEMVENFIDSIFDNLAIKQSRVYDGDHLPEFEKLFKADFKNTGFTWDVVKDKLRESAALLVDHVFPINGTVKDVIDEEKYPNGLVSIRVGGDKLSRGLTLPGLMTSYFLRTSKMYDTLMQMGRWFGYRDNYRDLCRIFTTGKLYNYYGHIANASEGLRKRIERMNTRVLSPNEYQQQIQSHPGMMLVTALNKQYHARKVSISYNNSSPQIYSFDVSKDGLAVQKANFLLVEKFLTTITESYQFEEKKLNTIVKDVPSDLIKNFVEEFIYSKNVVGIWDTKTITNYISEMNKINELTDWTVALFSNSSLKEESNIKVGPIFARPLRRQNQMSENVMTISRSNIMNELSERLDFSDEEVKEIKTRIPYPKREDFRNERPKERALLVIYIIDANREEANLEITIPTLAISFPNSENAKSTEFTVNSVEGNEDFEDDDDD